MVRHRLVGAGRRVAILVVVMVAALGFLGIGGPARAEKASSRGDLEASFHAGLTAFPVISAHSPTAAAIASPRRNPPGRIPLFPDAIPEYCAGTPLGFWITWGLWQGDDPAVLEGIHSYVALDGVPLREDRVLKPAASGADTFFSYWLAEGVPVLPALSIGDHTLELTYSMPDPDTGEIVFDGWPVDVRIIDCG